MKETLNVSSCELMHLRDAKKLEFIKKGNAFFYQLPKSVSLLAHPLGAKLINWHNSRHDLSTNNFPIQPKSIKSLEYLVSEILLPIASKFKRPTITYGFTSSELKNYISLNAPKGTAPKLDQHSSFELNKDGNMICSRGGAACDFYIKDCSMTNVVSFIVNNLSYDRLYFYGENRPIHISVNEDAMKYLQLMHESKNGRRYPGRKARGTDAIRLIGEL